VIDHYQWSEKTDGTRVGADAAEFRRLLERYYASRGWDEKGLPTDATLEALGLDAHSLSHTSRITAPKPQE